MESEYSILIEGELAKAHVEAAEAAMASQPGHASITGVRIGTAVTSIGKAGDDNTTAPFVDKITLTSVTFKDPANSLCETVGARAFDGCSNLTGTLTIPASLVELGTDAFAICNLTGLTFAGVPTIATIDVNAFYDNTNLGGTLAVPASVGAINASAFANCNLTGLTFDGVPTIAIIDASAFSNNPLAGTLTLPNTIEVLGDQAFQNAEFTTVTFTGGTAVAFAVSGTPAFGAPFNIGSAASLTPTPSLPGPPEITSLFTLTTFTDTTLKTARDAGTVTFT